MPQSAGAAAGRQAGRARRSWPVAPGPGPPERSAQPAAGPAGRRAASLRPPRGRPPADPPRPCSRCRWARRVAPSSGRRGRPARRPPGRDDRSPAHTARCRPAAAPRDVAARRGRPPAHRTPRRLQPGRGAGRGGSRAPGRDPGPRRGRWRRAAPLAAPGAGEWVVDQATRPTRRRAGERPPGSWLPTAAPSRGGGGLLDVGLRQHPLIAERGAECGGGRDGLPLGWQPSRFLTDRGEAEHAFQLAQHLGSVNAAAQQLDTTWPSLRKAFTRHGLGMPTPNPEAIRQRAIAAARQRTGQPATPSLDPMFVALNPGALPARERSPAELYQWVRREDQYAILGVSVVVELYSESHARQPTTRAWAIIRRADRNHRLAGQRASRSERRHADRADRLAGPSSPSSGRWRPMLANLYLPDRPDTSSGSTQAPLGYESWSAVPRCRSDAVQASLLEPWAFASPHGQLSRAVPASVGRVP